jgi:DNA-binding FadR family transcriptional regulator
MIDQMNELANQYAADAQVSAPVQTDAEVVSRLRAFIADGGYGPGDRLPPERRLVADLDLTRGALRKALDTLEREGAIWRQVGKGTFVSQDAAGQGENDIAVLSRQVTPLRMVRARLSIEPAIAREAAVNASAEALARMRAAIDRAAAASNWQEYEKQDDLFHRSVAEAADNILLLAVFDKLNAVRRAVAWRSVTRKTSRPNTHHSSFAEHAAIADAIEARDPEAAYDAMRRHLRSVSARLFEEG